MRFSLRTVLVVFQLLVLLQGGSVIDAFTATIQPAQQLSYFCSRSRVPSSIISSPCTTSTSTTTTTTLLSQEDDTPNNDDQTDDVDENGTGTTSTTTSGPKNNNNIMMTKAKWKKKRYLMMNDVIQLIEKRDRRAPRKAHEVVTRMQTLYQVHHFKYLLPDTQVYNLWINAIAKCSRREDAGQDAEFVLEEMRRNGVEPNVISYTTVMDAYAQSSGRRNRAAQDAERVLFQLLDLQMLNPNIKIESITSDTVMKAWANRGDVEGAQRAQDILEKLELLKSNEIQPTVHSYGIVIHAWATCHGGLEAAENAESILKRMLEPNHRIKPDTIIFNSVINAYASSKDPQQAGPKAVELLHRMQKLHNPTKGFNTKPDSVSYATVLTAWSHSDHPKAATETERVLKEMQEANKAAPCESPAPNTSCFNQVLHAWSRSSAPGAADRARNILQFMIKSNKEIIAPDAISFTSALAAIAKSKDPEKATKARQLLDTMMELYDTTQKPALKPTPIPFNAVLNAAAFSASEATEEQQKAALLIATATFTELRRRSNPDTVSYGNLMKCLHNLMPQGKQRNDMALKLFEKCSSEGLVGELVWTEVKKTVQSRELRRALSDDLNNEPPAKLHLQDLPKRWTNHVTNDKLATKKRNEARARKQQQRQRRRENNAAMASRRMKTDRRFRNISEPSYQSGKDL